MTALRKLAYAQIVCAALVASGQGLAQRSPPPPPPESARAGAPIDLTGQWVSVVTEDWRWRMVTPPKGDYASLPLTDAGRAAADGWNLAADNAAQLQCKAYGVGGLLRIPMRMRLSWQDADTLKLETDAGQQVRLFSFLQPGVGPVMPELDDFGPLAAEPTWQGVTRAQWFAQYQVRGLGYSNFPGGGGSLLARTANMRAGYLRKNGVPYSENAEITEQFNVFSHGDETWLVVTTIIDDPLNLTEPFVTSTNFRKEADRSRWSPEPCRTDEPLIAAAVPAAE